MEEGKNKGLQKMELLEVKPLVYEPKSMINFISGIDPTILDTDTFKVNTFKVISETGIIENINFTPSSWLSY